MSNIQLVLQKRKRSWPCIALLLLLLHTGCTVQYVAAFDENVRDQIYELAETVDKFWGTMLEMPEDEREYALFRDQYVDIETKLRSLVLKNEARPGNEESAEQSRILLELWIEDKDIHRELDSFNNFLANRHRRQFTEVFTAMARAEEEKRMENL
ncbi:MAG: hypothetical protein WEA58_10200 [Balneolaceae bacterium]